MASLDGFVSKYFNLNLVNKIFTRETGICPERTSDSWKASIIDHQLEHTKKFFYKDLYGHYGCVNTISFSPRGDLMASGSDDKRVLLWNIWESISDRNYKARAMKSEHNSNLFCLSFDPTQKRIYSGGNDELVIVHNIETGEAIDVINHMDDVYGISVDPTDNNIFASASNDIVLWDLRCHSSKSQRLAVGSAPFHSVMHNPSQTNIFVTANSKEGVDLYDKRQPMKKLFRFHSSTIIHNHSAMSAKFNQAGTKIIALRRKLAPVLYDVRSPYPQAEFESDEYYNSCTLKNCSYAGLDDQFVVSGSDNFKIYIWKIPEILLDDVNPQNPLKLNSIHRVTSAHHVLSGHRSIVNQVDFNNANGMFASTGVEKIIRLWSPFIQFEMNKEFRNTKNEYSRDFFSYTDYMNLVNNDRHYQRNQTTSEDTRLIAYFDSMIERDMAMYSMSSSEDDNSRSYFDLVYSQNPDEDENIDESKARVDLSKLTPDEFSTDSDEMFTIQKKFNFYKCYDWERLNDQDYLSLVFAKRMHARYISSVVDNLMQQIEQIVRDDKVNSNYHVNSNKSPKYKKHINCNSKKENSIRSILQKNKNQDQTIRDLLTLNKRIKSKKQVLFLFFAYRVMRSLSVAFSYGTLFEKSRNKFLEVYGDLNLKEALQKAEGHIKHMSSLKDPNLYDKRLYNILHTLLKKLFQLRTLLEGLDVKPEYIKSNRFLSQQCHLRAFIASSEDDNDINIDDDLESEEEDIVMNNSEDNVHSSDSNSSASSSGLISSSSSSSSNESDNGDSKPLDFEQNGQKFLQTAAESNDEINLGPGSSKNNGVATNLNDVSDTISDNEIPSTSSGYIFFKNIVCSNKRYRSRKHKKSKNKPKKQRKS